MKILMRGLTALAVTACTFAATVPAFAAGQADLITPVTKELTFIFVPKVIHPWYDVVAQGGQFAVDELAKSRGTSPGPLAGQSIINSLSSTLRQVLNYSTGTSGISSLTSLGVSADKTGHLSLDTTAFTTATTGQFTALLTFLGSSTGSGFLQNATNALNGVEDVSTGSIKTTLASLSTQSAHEDALIATEQDRVNQLQTNLQARFSAADALIASLEQQVNFVTGLFQAFQTSNQSGH